MMDSRHAPFFLLRRAKTPDHGARFDNNVYLRVYSIIGLFLTSTVEREGKQGSSFCEIGILHRVTLHPSVDRLISRRKRYP